MNFINNSSVQSIESWYIPVDIVTLVSSILACILGLIFLIISVSHKSCWTVPMMLACNSCFTVVTVSLALFSSILYTLRKDLKSTDLDRSLCVIQGFIVYITCAMHNYSYVLKALYQYIVVVYPARISWRSVRYQGLLIIIQWIYSILFALPLLLTSQVIYNEENQICQVPLSFSIAIIYLALFLYTIPSLSMLFIYIKLVRYIRQVSNRLASAQRLFHIRREMKIVRRTLILVNIIIILGVPYMIFTLISFFTTPPKYSFRVAFLFINVSLLCIIMTLFKFTEPVMTIVRRIFCPVNVIEPANRNVA